LKTKLTILGLFLLMAAVGWAQTDLLPIRLAGIIYADDTSQNTPFVEIINLRTGTGVISDSIGFFKTEMLNTDSLLFRCLGFENEIFTLHDSLKSSTLFVEIRLTETSYLLDVIDIWALSRMNQFKNDFTNMPLANDGWENQMIIPGISKKNYQWIRKDEKALGIQPLWNPNSGGINPFRAKERNARTLIELINNEEGNRIIDEKYNLELLSLISGFTGDTLIDFKLYLNFSRSFLLSNDVYQIVLKIKTRLPEFKKTYFKEE